MRILITNDDSVSAEQLLPLIRWCRKLGDVTTVVPKYEQSGKSHGIELHKPFEVKEVALAPDVSVYTVDSTPADCVRYAVLGKKMHFDLVISGINRGFNIGCDIMYSGTVAAVCEAAALGLQAIAISTSPEYYSGALIQLDRVFDYIRKHELFALNNIYNVNIPPEAKDIRITHQGGPYYSDDFLPLENDLYTPVGKCVYEDNGDLTLDTNAVMHGYISIMPLTIDRTNTELYHRLSELNK